VVKHIFVSVITLVALAELSGCVSQAELAARQAVVDYHYGDYADAQKLLEPIAKTADENFVLNNDRLGSTTLVQYELQQAEAAFLRAYEVINSVGVNNGGRSLGAALVDEKIKVWKGEPFERAMTNYYLGVVYYMQHDYNNARAALENALFKLHDYGPDGNRSNDPHINPDQYSQVDSDFILAQYLLARCYQRLGREDLARSNYQRVVRLRPDLQPLADYDRNARSNVLLLIDYGQGPHKITDNDGSLVGFAPAPWEVGAPPSAEVEIDNAPANMPDANPLVDLIALAQDRRWQSIDTIRAVKSLLGSGLIIGGAADAMLGQRQTDAEVGLGLMAAGVLLKAASQADVRVWDTLPRSVYAVPLTLAPGSHDISVDFYGTSRQTWHGLVAPATGESTYYLRLQRFQNQQYHWPPTSLNGWPATQPASGG
jgi:tetratricopeptide (TPR) repeat protein